ncbi:MAG: transporter substrate-binding domain-containing protein [Deltaproteobacteria bacterium]|nr:transporter substrate-binding domain-containing protein [Deltaproteobacteria bacterium]
MSDELLRKIIPLLLLLLIICFNSSPSFAASVVGEDIPMSSEWRIPSTEDLPSMLKRAGILVGTTYSLTNFFFLPNGEKHGFEYSLLKEYEAFLNRKRSRWDIPVVISFLPMPHDKLIPALLGGYCDIVAAGLTITPQRYMLADFTDPYLTGISEVIVTHKSVTGVASFMDLAGKEIYVRRSSSYYSSLVGINGKLKARNLPLIRIKEADETLATESILEMVNAGIVKITVADSHLAELWSKVLPDIEVHKDVKVRKDGSLAWMIRKNNPLLKESLNKFIRAHRKGTFKGNIYFERYFKDTRWIRNPLSKKTRERLARYETWFKKYGRIYGIDWRLLISLAFHESGLDHSKRSPSGAIGLMQVMPELARDKRIAIRDIHLPENNIHASTKYLALLRDKYFSKPGIGPDARLRFALAAYNAGPSKVEKIRRRAKRMGYDPSRWFGNCEVAALREVGQETVLYVRNINIYYIALRLSEPYMKEAHESRGGL